MVGEAAKAFEFVLEPVEFFVTEILQINEAGTRAGDAAQEFV